MSVDTSLKNSVERLKLVVIVPTYNNSKTLPRVLDGILQYTSSILVINDGSTDTTRDILSGYEHINQIHLPENLATSSQIFGFGLKRV